MGWSFCSSWQLKRDIIQNRIRIQDWTDPKTGIRYLQTTLAYCVRGNNLWSVIESRKFNPNETEPFFSKKFLGLDLLKWGGKSDGWGYKDMDESSGPYQFNCPLKYLDMVPQTGLNEYALTWRKAVREYHAEQAAKRAKKKGIVKWVS
jgi:hypothetical protein